MEYCKIEMLCEYIENGLTFFRNNFYEYDEFFYNFTL